MNLLAITNRICLSIRSGQGDQLEADLPHFVELVKTSPVEEVKEAMNIVETTKKSLDREFEKKENYSELN